MNRNSRRAPFCLPLLFVAAAACSSSSATTTPVVPGANGDAGGVGGTGSVTGSYGSDAIKPVVAAYWIGKPGDPTESAGGPFVYLFSSPVTCEEISKGSGWAPSLPAGTQVLELIIGTSNVGTAASASSKAGADLVEANYFGPAGGESRATAGSVSLTAYTKDTAVDGTVDVTFPSGNAKGTFHATWCPAGQER